LFVYFNIEAGDVARASAILSGDDNRRERGSVVTSFASNNEKALDDMDFLQDSDDDERNINDVPNDIPVLSSRIRAEQELEKYLAYNFSKNIQIQVVSSQGTIDFWMTVGKREFPHFAQVAICLLGCLPGSGVLENDFSALARILTRHRTRILPSTTEMMLFCKQNYDLIPDIIPIISVDKIDDHIPKRLTDPTMLNAMRELHPYDDEDEVDILNEFEVEDE
jgi:hypothetical protein